jgi:hypothetical protein
MNPTGYYKVLVFMHEEEEYDRCASEFRDAGMIQGVDFFLSRDAIQVRERVIKERRQILFFGRVFGLDCLTSDIGLAMKLRNPKLELFFFPAEGAPPLPPTKDFQVRTLVRGRLVSARFSPLVQKSAQFLNSR